MSDAVGWPPHGEGCPREAIYELPCPYAEKVRARVAELGAENKQHRTRIAELVERDLAERLAARVAELEGQLRDMRILGGKTLAERNDALARVAELEAGLTVIERHASLDFHDDQLRPALRGIALKASAVLAKGREGGK